MTKNTTSEIDMNAVLSGEANGKSRWWLKFLIIAGIMIVIIAAYFMSGKNNPTGISYQKAAVVRGDLTNTVSATGNLEPTNQVEIGSELSGIVEAVYVDYNDTVTIGQTLALLDTTKLKAKVKQSKAAHDAANARVLQAKATVKETKVKLGRMKQARELSGGKVPSLYDIEAAEAAFERAEADLKSAQAAVVEARATLDSNEEDLSKAKILSPINGVVLDRSVEPGQTVAASLQAPVLFTLAEDLTKMELHVDVDEADVGLVRKGQPASFTVDAYPDRTFSAEIKQVRYGAQTTEGVVTYETVLKLDNSELLLRPGMTATAEIVVQKVANKILVPNAALRFSPPKRSTETAKDNPDSNSSMISKILPRPPHKNRSSNQEATINILPGSHESVYMEENGQLKPVPVITGISDGIKTEVIQGALEPGMNVVINILRAGK